MELSDKDRRNRDIYNFVREKQAEKIKLSAKDEGVEKYRYQAILEMARIKFYLAHDTIADIVRAYEPPAKTDPDQLDIFAPTTNQPTNK